MDKDAMQNCSEARALIGRMNQMITSAKGKKGNEAVEASVDLAQNYISKQLNIISSSYNGMDPVARNNVVTKALADAVVQLHDLIEYGDKAKHQSGTDFMKMIHVEHMVVRLQAKFRQTLAIKRQERQIEEQKALIKRKEAAKQNVSNEELVLSELKTRLAKRGMTPEAFFRTCDVEYTKTVPVAKFKAMLQNFKLELSRGQVSRLCLILDEDQEGNISLLEMQNALEAYGQSGEKHVDPDGGDYYVPFDHRAMFKLLEILQKRDMTHEELYLMCDCDNNNDVNISELEKVLESMSDEFYTKDCQAIHNFMDIDNNNACTKSEFLDQLRRADRLRQQDKERREGRMTKAGDLRGRMTDTFNDREIYDPMDKYIDGFSSLSSNSQYERLTDYMSQQFNSRSIDPARVHSMADKNRTGKANLASIMHCLKKLLPQFDDEFLDCVPRILGMSQSEELSRDEWANMFDIHQRGAYSKGAPQKSAVQKQRDDMKKEASADQDWTLLKYLAEQLRDDNLQPRSFFKQLDTQHNGVLNVDQIKDGVKHWYPNAFEGLNYKKLERALDMNQKGYVSLQDFVSMMEKALAKGSSTDTIKNVPAALTSKGKPDLRKPAGPVTAKPPTKDQFVLEQDRISPKEAIKIINEHIMKTDQAISTEDDKVLAAIEVMFDKITAWKEQFGDSEEYENILASRISLYNRPGPKIKIHTFKTLWHHVTGVVSKDSKKTLQDEIGLSDVEASFMVITSIDPEYFPWMLIEQSDFVKWFTTDFSGEGLDEKQEEEDFQNDKLADWQEATSLALELSGMGMRKDLDQVFNDMEWWENMRFKNFGDGLMVKFNQDKKLYKNFELLFKQHNNQLSYYDFFTYVEHTLHIDLADWEEDALQRFLDSQGMAFIEFNEFNEFLRDYGYNTGIPVEEEDEEARQEQRKAISYKDYEMEDDDYFMGSATMLTSEKSALATCRRLLKECQKKKMSKWQDPDFGPKDSSDLDGLAHSLYPGGKIPSPGYIEPKDVEWMWSEDRLKPGEQLKFIEGGAAASDCIQGDIGDCWFISALSVCANRDELIVGGSPGIDPVEGMIVDNEFAQNCSKGIFPPIFHKYRAKGIYCLRFFKNFDWIYVIVDERIPVKKGTKDPIFGHCPDTDEMWVQLIEKAYAKLHGNYGNLISGYIDEGVQELTGLQPMKLLIRNETSGVFPHEQVKMLVQKHDPDGIRTTPDGALFFLMEDSVDDGCLLGCSIKGYGKTGEALIDGEKCGLILDHAYAIQDVIFDDKNYKDKVTGEPLKLMRLRNPWGKVEWNGAWSSNSKEMKTYKKELEHYIKTLPLDEQFSLDNDDDGIFFMSYEDWRDNFSSVFINIDFPEAWTGVRFKAAWTKKNSYGLPKSSKPEELRDYAKNPQFLVRPAVDTELVFSMVQTGGRLPTIDKNGNKCYTKYPFQETLHYANVCIFEVEDKGSTPSLDKFETNESKRIFVSPVKRERENGGTVKLLAKRAYVIVCATELKGMTGELWLSLYIDQALRDVDITRTGINDEGQPILPRYIKEESEKVFSVPAWKLDMVRESIPYMMTEDDSGNNFELHSD